MDYKKFRPQLEKLLDSLPEGVSGATVSWKQDGMFRCISLSEQYDNPSMAQFTMIEYPDNNSLQNVMASGQGISLR